MRNLVTIFFFLLLFVNLKAQTTIEYKTTKNPDDFLKNIDTSSFNSGILYDRVIPHAKLLRFNVKENTSDVIHFEQALNELYRARDKRKFMAVVQLRRLKNLCAVLREYH